MPNQPVLANEPIPVEDWRAAALDLYHKQCGSRCIRCFSNIHDPAERTLYIREGVYYLVHTKGCPER